MTGVALRRYWRGCIYSDVAVHNWTLNAKITHLIPLFVQNTETTCGVQSVRLQAHQ